MDWPTYTLDDVCVNIFAGGDVPKHSLSKEKTSKFSVPIYANGEKNKGLYGYTEIARVTAPSMTVSARGTIGYSEIRYEPFFPVVRLIVLTPNTELVHLEFLKYILLGTDFKKGGTSIPQLTVPMIKKYKCKLPPISEQERIVSILNNAFSNIDKVRITAEKNLKNVRELFNSYLQQVFSQQENDWIETTLGTVAEFKNGLNYSKSSKGEVVKVAGVSDFQDRYSVSCNQFGTARIDGELDPSYELKNNDILTVRSNGNKRLIGRCVLVKNIDDKASYSGFIIRIRVQNQGVLPAFLTHYLKSPSAHELLIGSGEGANISNLNQKTLNKLPIRFPSKDKQAEICVEIERLKAETNKLELIYTQKLRKLDELKNSILQKAFSGGLKESKGTAI